MIDWDAIGVEAIAHLKTLLRYDTSNPPGNEIVAARYLEKVLEADGITSVVVESKPGRANLVARLGSSAASGPLLLASHLDVVPAEESDWLHPPFEAVEDNGFVYGRGAVDMKHMTVYSLMTMLLLKRYGTPLKRDLIMVATADEEAGCEHGAEFLVDQHPDLIQSEYGLNEVGGFQVHLQSGARVYPVQVAEKGFVWVRMTAEGTAGHGSMPHQDNAVVKLAQAIDRLHTTPLPHHRTPVAVRFIKSVGELLGFGPAALLRLVVEPHVSQWALKLLPDQEKAKVFAASLRNTACPTGLAAGLKQNVIPQTASAVLDCRILPGQTIDTLLAEVQAVVGPDFRFEVLKSGFPYVIPSETPLFKVIERVLARRDPGCHVLPYLNVGFTDAHVFQRLGIKTYGFTPLKLPPDLNFSELVHSPNERIPVSGFLWGVRTFFETVREFCGAS